MFLGVKVYGGGCTPSATNTTCATAQTLTLNGACTPGTTCNATAATGLGSCSASGSGGVVWYRFNTGTNTSLNLSLLNTLNGCYVGYVLWGPYTAGSGCTPSGVGSAGCLNTLPGDPGYHTQLTGLTAGRDYLLQILGKNCVGPGAESYNNFCIAVATPQTNNSPSSPTPINSCGVTFSGDNYGYVPSGAGIRKADLDNNPATTCPTCTNPGDDVPFVINNDSWFNFCSSTAGTWNVSFSVSSCVFSGANSGLQMTILTGFPNSLSTIANAPNPTYAGGSWTSSNFSIAAGQCVYMVVDGFAGDMCSYSYVLTNVTGGCIILPIELLSFNVKPEKENVTLEWKTASEKNNDFFTIERSSDGVNFEAVGKVKGSGTTNSVSEYRFIDTNPLAGLSYYRLTQTDFDGTTSISGMSAVKIGNEIKKAGFAPNPVVEVGTVTFNSEVETVVNIQIVDMLGRKVYDNEIKTTIGQNTLPIDFTGIPNGTYSLSITNDNIYQRIKFYKGGN